MPRPPILPTTDWKIIYSTGKSYDEWLSGGESKENCENINNTRRRLTLAPAIEGYLGALNQPVYVIAIAEDWCGDVVRHVPVLQKMADITKHLHVKYITREADPQTFVRFLTNGGEAIPKFVFLNHKFIECGNWGPMPEDCRELIARGKACDDVKTAREKVAALYTIDKHCQRVVKELLQLIDITSATAV